MIICNTPVGDREKVLGMVIGVSCEIMKYGKNKNDYQTLQR